MSSCQRGPQYTTWWCKSFYRWSLITSWRHPCHWRFTVLLILHLTETLLFTLLEDVFYNLLLLLSCDVLRFSFSGECRFSAVICMPAPGTASFRAFTTSRAETEGMETALREQSLHAAAIPNMCNLCLYVGSLIYKTLFQHSPGRPWMFLFFSILKYFAVICWC